jgi:hypothetical protein
MNKRPAKKMEVVSARITPAEYKVLCQLRRQLKDDNGYELNESDTIRAALKELAEKEGVTL